MFEYSNGTSVDVVMVISHDAGAADNDENTVRLLSSLQQQELFVVPTTMPTPKPTTILPSPTSSPTAPALAPDNTPVPNVVPLWPLDRENYIYLSLVSTFLLILLFFHMRLDTHLLRRRWRRNVEQAQQLRRAIFFQQQQDIAEMNTLKRKVLEQYMFPPLETKPSFNGDNVKKDYDSVDSKTK